MRTAFPGRAVAAHLALLAVLFALQFVLPEYNRLVLGRVMVLATFALGYNVLFGYTGLLSLGHAMFFAAGLYGAGLSAYHLEFGAPAAFATGIILGAAFTLAVGLIVLRTSGVQFMIVTLMFAQAAYLLIFYMGSYTRGEEGLTIPQPLRRFDLLGTSIDLTDPAARYNLALALLAVTMLAVLAIVRSPVGRVLVAIRENEERTRMLGYGIFRYKLFAVVVSGTVAAAAGAAYALLFAYIGATFASIQYSIFPLLWTLMGGAGTVAGPFFGTLAMFYLGDVSSGYTSAYMLVVGVALVLLVLFFPKGLLGSLRARWLPWLP